MAYQGPTTRDAIRENLKTSYDKPSMTTRILLAEEDIGRVVTYGKKNMLRVSKTGLRPTVFNGRAQVNGHSFSVEASSTGSMLNALAVQIGRTLRSDRKAIATVTEEPSPAPEPNTSPRPR